MGASHPECPARLSAIEDQLVASGLSNYLQHVEAPPASRVQLERLHAPEYITALERAAPAKGLVHLDPDTALNPHTVKAAKRAAGAAALATDMVISVLSV